MMDRLIVKRVLTVIAILLCGLLSHAQVPPTADREVLLIPRGYTGDIFIVYRIKSGQPPLREDGARLYRIPSNGILLTQEEPNTGINGVSRFYYEDQSGPREPLERIWHSTVRDTPENRAHPQVEIFYPGRAGYGSMQMGCQVEFSWFRVGTRAQAISEGTRHTTSRLDKVIRGSGACEGQAPFPPNPSSPPRPRANSPSRVPDFTSQAAQARGFTLRRLATQPGAERDPKTVDLMELGLTDPDPAVRRTAVAVLSTLLTAGAEDRRSSQRGLLDLRGASVQRVLVPLLDDSDFVIRGVAVKGLAFIGPWTTALETMLITAYDREPDSGVRNVIVWELSSAALTRTSPAMAAMFVRAMNDDSPEPRRSAARGLGRLRPAAGLPRLVAELRSGEAKTRPSVIDALMKYGADAKPYLGELEGWRILADAEGRRDEAYQLREAIVTISGAR
jgi:hypothetical protein